MFSRKSSYEIFFVVRKEYIFPYYVIWISNVLREDSLLCLATTRGVNLIAADLLKQKVVCTR